MADVIAPTVILTGAGASNPLGFPTTQQFFDASVTNVAWATDRQQLFELIKQKLDVRVLDVEDILRILQPAEDFFTTPAGALVRDYVNHVHGKSDRWDEDIAKLAVQIRERCFAVYTRRPSLLDVDKLYLPLFDLLDWRNVRIDFFTLNYDLTTDVIVALSERHDVQIYDGFNRLSDFDPEPYKAADLKLRIFRLHGSMSWVETTPGVVTNQRHSARTIHPHIYIPPGFKGDPTGPENSAPVREAHNYLVESLRAARQLLIIGYSFRDAHINKVMDQMLGMNRELKVLLVNPAEPDALDSAYRDIVARHPQSVVHLKEKFGSSNMIVRLKRMMAKSP